MVQPSQIIMKKTEQKFQNIKNKKSENRMVSALGCQRKIKT